METAYENLNNEILKRGIKKTAIAASVGISTNTLRNRIAGKQSFNLREACTIRDTFFPDQTLEYLFERKP